MLAMQETDLMDQFYAKARPEGNQVRILDNDGHVFLDVKPDGEEERGEERPEIGRGFVRFYSSFSMKARSSGAGSW